jgi:hypothetical protein
MRRDATKRDELRNEIALFVLLVVALAHPKLAAAQLNQDAHVFGASHESFTNAANSIEAATNDGSPKSAPTSAAPQESNVPAKSAPISARLPDSNVPGINLSAKQNSFVLDAQEEMLPWGEWHHRICKALGKQVKKASGKMLGTVNLRITIDKDQKIVAELVSCTSERLGQVCTEATKELDRDPVFAFPQGSKRQTVAIDFQIKRNLYGLPFDQYVKDDYERLNQD